MEALWNLEDKWKLSTQEAILFFSCTIFLIVVVVGFCAATVWRRRATKKIQHGGNVVVEVGAAGHWVTVKKALTGSVRWSKASKWGGDLCVSGSRKEQPTPLLARGGGEVGWPSHNAGSPVWQRPILMGEKCELPRFSGLILYDQGGKPLDQPRSNIQEQPTVRATLRDLL
ncbi:hypothetical protein L1887_25247 [Cichorium endivia]|nr:hypothetical protein L1887_25247 [Cichorium endivia]